MSLSLDPDRDLIAWWPAADEACVHLLHQIGINALITTTPAAIAACRAAGIAAIAEIPAEPSEQALAAAREQGFSAAAVSAGSDPKALRDLVRAENGFVSFVYLKAEQVAWDVTPAFAVVRSGTWPGIHPLDTEVASASEGVWIDANSSLAAYLRAVYPQRPAILGYRPDEDAGVSANRAVPFESVEIALADAFAAGGSVILSFPEDYKQALLRGDARALEAWQSLRQVAGFLKQQRAGVRGPAWSRTAVIAGSLEQSGEVLNLAYRQSLSPKVLPVDRLPALKPAEIDVIAAVNIPISQDAARNLLQFAAGGGCVLTTPPPSGSAWWNVPESRSVRKDKDRDVFAVGLGRVYAYRGAIDDPGEFALDLREAAAEKSGPARGPKNLDIRIWETGIVLGVLRHPPGTTQRGGLRRIVLVLTNYGSPVGYDFLIGVRGAYRRAAFAQAGEEGFRPLDAMPRPGRVECNLKDFRRIAIVVFEE